MTVVAAEYVRLKCGQCDQGVYVNPAAVALVVDNGTGKYAFLCPRCGPRRQDAHPWLIAQLAHAGVAVTDPADVMAVLMDDDEAMDAELAKDFEGWDQ